MAFADVVGTNRLPNYVRRELDRFGFASSLATLASPPEEVAPLSHGRPAALPAIMPFENPQATTMRFKEAEEAAFQVARSRRFELRVVEAPVADAEACKDGIEDESDSEVHRGTDP